MRFGIVCLVALVVAGGCSPKVTLVDNNQNIYLSGRWNSTDSRQTGVQIADQVLSERWLVNYQEQHMQKKPVVICGTILNKSHEHIDAETFRQDIERAMINSGRVRVVQDAQKRQELRTERAEQQQYASETTQKNLANETGADFVLQGTINSIVDQNSKKKLVYYQINLTLTDLETSEVVWIGEKKITKMVQ